MIFEVWQASESMKILLKNDAKYGTGSDTRFLMILDGFWIDFGSVFGPFWRPEGFKSQGKSRKGFEDALGGVKGGLVEAFGGPWRLCRLKRLMGCSGNAAARRNARGPCSFRIRQNSTNRLVTPCTRKRGGG